MLIRRIFRMAKTTGLVAIADTLNREGVPSPRGGLWSDSTLRGMVRNPAYKGIAEYGKTFRGKYHRVHREQPVEFGFLQEGRVNHGDVPEGDWYVEPERHETLISPDEFDEVQAAPDARSRRPAGALRSEKHVYWLSGIARCARCNAPLQGQTQGGKNPKYTCSTARKYGSGQCAYYSLNAPELEAHVVGEVRKYLDTDCAMESLRLGLEQLLDECSEGKTHLERARLQAKDMAAKKEALFKILEPDNIEMFQPQIDDLTAEEKRLRRVIAEAEREAGVQTDREAFIANALEHYREHVLALRGGCENALRESLLALGISVTYDPDKKEGGIAVSPFVCSATA